MSRTPDDMTSHFYPESRLSGFARNDHRIVFYNIVNAILKPDHHVLDFGAGRGKWAEIESGFKLAHTTLKGRCARVVGCDMDPVVRENPLIDEAVVIAPGEPLPFADESFDIITSWAVLEHVDDPAFVTSEIARLLKPGGVFCAWTPNKWGYVGIGARLVPNRLHSRFLRILDTGGRREADVFPTRYRVNTLGAVKARFPESEFSDFSFVHTGPPAYHGGRYSLALASRVYNWLMPSWLGQCLFVIVQKK